MGKKIITFVIVIIAIIAILYSCGKRKIYNTIINTVKDGYFAEVTYDVTIGEMMQTLCSDSKWEYTPDTDSGLVFVTYTGNMKGQPLKMMFLINNMGGNMMFQLNYFSLNGEEAANKYGPTGVDEIGMMPFVLYEAYRSVKGK